MGTVVTREPESELDETTEDLRAAARAFEVAATDFASAISVWMKEVFRACGPIIAALAEQAEAIRSDEEGGVT